jgi:S1-C subfamily serine protease
MTELDWIALAFVALTGLAGLRRGLLGTALGFAGLVGGAILGDRIAPHLLTSGSSSPYMPVVALAGALAGALLGRAVAALVASFLRNGLRLVPGLHTLDSAGGALAGTASGLVIVWVLGAVALQLPGQVTLRRDAQRSSVLKLLDSIAPPISVLRELSRIDELPTIVGPAPPVAAPDPRVLSEPAVRADAPSVVKITAQACGLGVEGSGWVAAAHLVVTAAHVVAGATGIDVDGQPAHVYAIDRHNDVAVLEVPSFSARPLRIAQPRAGTPVAILGYPEDGPFDATAGRIGATVQVLDDGASRLVTEFEGSVRPGNSGGPAINAAGEVETTVFASRVGSPAGYGVPTSAVSSALAAARHPVSSGGCES